FLGKLQGSRLRVPATVALFTGMRLGEVLALRWNRVDLDAQVIQVRETLEQTSAHGTRFKPPKSRAGRRDITLPDILIETLRAHRMAMLEMRLHLGSGPMMRCCLRTSKATHLTPTQRQQRGQTSRPALVCLK